MASVDELVARLQRLESQAPGLVAWIEDADLRMKVQSAGIRLAAFVQDLVWTARAPANEPPKIDDEEALRGRPRSAEVEDARASERLAAWAAAPMFVSARGHVFWPPAPSACDQDGPPIRRQP
jgi:hypothetical protein